MPVTGSPIVIPQKVLDKFWLTLFASHSDLKAQTAVLSIVLQPYNLNGDTGPEIALNPVDVFALCDPNSESFDPEAAQIYAAVLAYCTKLAVAQGKIQAQGGQ